MSRRPKFKPEIRRIKLNPEQAVLACSCYANGHRYSGTSLNGPNMGVVACGPGGRADFMSDAPKSCTLPTGSGFTHYATMTLSANSS
jgi:hypothetical protein